MKIIIQEYFYMHGIHDQQCDQKHLSVGVFWSSTNKKICKNREYFMEEEIIIPE